MLLKINLISVKGFRMLTKAFDVFENIMDENIFIK